MPWRRQPAPDVVNRRIVKLAPFWKRDRVLLHRIGDKRNLQQFRGVDNTETRLTVVQASEAVVATLSWEELRTADAATRRKLNQSRTEEYLVRKKRLPARHVVAKKLHRVPIFGIVEVAGEKMKGDLALFKSAPRRVESVFGHG